MAEETAGGGQPVAQAAANAVAPDALTADLLQKHAAGQPLTQREYGKLGAFASKLKAWATGKAPGGPAGAPGAPAQPPGPAPGPGQPPGVAPVAPGTPPPDSLEPVPVDPGLAQRTTNALLSRCENIARRVVANAATEAGATGPTLARFDAAARLPKDDRELMVSVSPDVCASLGLDVRSYPLTVFFGALGLWATDIWLVVNELKAMKAEKPAARTSPAPAAAGDQVNTAEPAKGAP